MGINRFYQPTEVARFNPLSFQEMSFAPIMMRQREDALMNSVDELMQKRNNIRVPDDYSNEIGQITGQIDQDIDKLVQRVNKEGVSNMEVLGDFRNLRNNYNKHVSASGAIGKAMLIQDNIKKSRDFYFKAGLEMGHNAHDLARNWAAEEQKYKQLLPTVLGDSGEIPDMPIVAPPPKVDIADEAKEIHSLLGSIGYNHGDLEVVTSRGEDGKPQVQVFHKEKGQVTTEPAIAAWVDYMKRKVLSPDSDLHRYMKYKGQDPENLLMDINSFGTIMLDNKVQTDKKPLGGGSGSGSGKSKGEEDKRDLGVYKANTGVRKIGQYSTHALSKIIDTTKKAMAMGEMDEREAEKALNTYHHLYAYKQRIEKSDEFANEFTSIMQGNELFERAGIDNYQQLRQFLENPDKFEFANKKIQIQGSQIGAGMDGRFATIDKYGNLDYNNNPGLKNITKTGKELVEEEYLKLYNKTTAGRDTVIDGDTYFFNPGDATNKFKKSFNIDQTQLRAQALEGKLSVMSFSDSTDGKLTPLGIGTTQEDLDQFLHEINIMDSYTTTVHGIDDGGLVANPSMFMTIEGKIGGKVQKYSVSVDLKDNGDGFGSAVLDALEEQLNPNDALIVDSMRDKIANDHIVLQPAADIEYSPVNSSKIVQSAKNHNARFGFDAFEDESTDLTSPIWDYAFVKPDGSDYAVAINEEDSTYSLYRKDKDTGRTEALKFEDYFKNELGRQWAKQYGTDNFDEINPATRRQVKASIMSTIASPPFNVSDLDGEALSIPILGSDRGKFKEIIVEARRVFNQNLSETEREMKLSRLFDSIAGMEVRTRKINLLY